MRGAEFRARPFGLPNLAPDGVGGSSGLSEGAKGKPFSYYFYQLKRRHVEQFSLRLGYHQNYTNPALEMSRLAARMRQEAEYDGSAAAKDTTNRLERAHFALTFAHFPGVILKNSMVYEYKKYQAENADKGEVVRGVVIHEGEEKEMLKWMLKKSEVAVDLGVGDICIPFSPLEREMQQVQEDIQNERRRRGWIIEDL